MVASYEYFDADDMDYEPEEIEEKDFLFWADSFEEFWSGYWIAHEVMFSQAEGTPPPNVDPRFLELYSRGG